MSLCLLLESGAHIKLESNAGALLLEPAAPPVIPVFSSAQITALYFQGLNASAGSSFGPVGSGMVFQGIWPTGTLWPPTNQTGPLWLGKPLLPSGIIQVATPLSPGTQYTVLGVITDPLANHDDPGAHTGDQVALSGGIGTVSALVLATALRIS